MTTHPSPPSLDLNAWLDQGYVVVPGLLTPDEVAELRTDIVRLCRGDHPSEMLKPVAPDATDAQAMEDVLCIFNAHHISPVIARYARHPGMGAVLGRIVGAHLPWWDGAVKAVQSQVFVKAPGHQGMAWHQDEYYIPTRDRSLVAAWIALDEVDEANGCLRVIPGSHRTGYLWPQRPHDDPSEYDYAPTCVGFDPSGEVPVRLQPGDAVFLHGYLMHRSTKNRSDRPRRALSFHTMNAWSLLPWLHPPGMDPVSKADVRSVVQVCGDDPYEWKGRTQGEDVFLRTCAANEAGLQRRFDGDS